MSIQQSGDLNRLGNASEAFFILGHSCPPLLFCWVWEWVLPQRGLTWSKRSYCALSPYKQPDSLITIRMQDDRGAVLGVSYRELETWRSGSNALADVSFYFQNSGVSRVSIDSAEGPQFAQSAFVSSNLFSLMGVQPSVGRAYIGLG
jgi:hypothetical protein